MKKHLLPLLLLTLVSCNARSGHSDQPQPADPTAYEPLPTAPVVEEVEPMPSFADVKKIVKDSWDKQLSSNHSVLSKYGMSCLKFDVDTSHRDEFGDCVDAFYGKNAEVLYQDEGYIARPTGPHAIVVEIMLTTCNGENVSFSDKEDFDRFMATVKKNDSELTFEGTERTNGMYTAKFAIY